MATEMTDLVQNLNDAAEVTFSLGDQARRQLLQACDRLKSKLETPADITARLLFSVSETVT